MRLIDFGARKIPADDIKAAGYDGVVVSVSDSQPGANFGAKPITREYADALRAAGLHIISNFQCGKPGGAAPSDFTRGFDGGIEDARTALRLHKAAGGPDSAPIIFSIDEDIDPDTWDGIAVEWFRGINSILGVERTGIYGHSRVCAWAIRDGVVGHSTTPGRRWVWQTRAWSYGENVPEAVLFQDVIDTASNPGPLVDSERVDVNEVLAADFGQWDLDRSSIPAITDFDEYAASAPPAPAVRTSGEAFPGCAVAQGATGRHVTMIQDRLNTVADAGLLVDGEFAPLTTRAVTAFQKSRGLVADGEIGPTTWVELFASQDRIFPKGPGWRARAIAAPAKDLTGPGITTSVAMEAADLGILRWDPDRTAIAAMFGDNFEKDGMAGDWQSPSIVMYDKDYNVLGIPALDGAVPTIRPNARRRQLWPYQHDNPEYSTILPCDFIRIGDWWHVAVMVTAGLGNELRTEFHRSRDLVNWEVRPELSLPHRPRPLHPGNVMLTFDRIGDYVYIFGTGGLARNKPIWMWRNKAGEFPLGWWEPRGWDGARWGWGIANERTPILGGRFGELCFRYLQGNCVLSFFDAAGYKQQARTVQRPEDNWVNGANVVDYVLGTQIPNPYGGYISPLSRLNEWNGMHFWVSQWPGPPHRKPYRVYLVKDTLWAKGPLREVLATRISIPSKESQKSGVIDGILADKDQQVEEFEAEYAFTAADLDYRTFTADAVAARRRPAFPELKDEYSNLWAEMAIRRDKLPEVDAIVERIVGHKDTYRRVEGLSRVPWFVIAIIHNLEAGGDFTRHLHNGDPLTARTVHVPAGRPSSGNPPFTWEQSAIDALEYDGLTRVTDWSTEHLAYLFENFNGWGYRLYHPHVKSPYLWSYSNHYTSGKYIGDGQWSETAVSRQCGAMVLLKRLHETGEIRLDYARFDTLVARTHPAAMPMTSDALKQTSTPMTWDALTQTSTPMTRDALDRATGVEKVLPYDHSIVPQETGFWCGPAATQVVLNSRGIIVAERDLALSIGTHTGGTDYVGLIERDLDKRVPQAGYMSVYMPNDPPTSAQRERLWAHLVRGVDAGWGMIMNWVAPPSNYPRGVKGSISPAYRGGTVYHYVAAMGYDDNPGARAVWIADSGFRPFGYWCGFDQVATLIPPKGYTYADTAP